MMQMMATFQMLRPRHEPQIGFVVMTGDEFEVCLEWETVVH